jgi:hypothetical protein
MARALGLVFQLDQIDYDRSSFRNSDLSINQLREVMEKNARKSGAGEELDSLFQTMQGSSPLARLMNVLFEIIGSNPHFQALARLALIETLDQIKGDLSQLQEAVPEMEDLLRAVLQERNKHVLRDLQRSLKVISPNDSIAVFYGSGHMEDLERRVTTGLHYRQADEIWLTAFAVNPGQSGLSRTEMAMVRSIIAWQLKPLKR